MATSRPNETEGFAHALYSLVLLTNNITYKRMEKAVTELKEKYDSVPIGRLLFTENPQLKPVEPVDFTPLNPGLNQSQIDAIKFALGSQGRPSFPTFPLKPISLRSLSTHSDMEPSQNSLSSTALLVLARCSFLTSSLIIYRPLFFS